MQLPQNLPGGVDIRDRSFRTKVSGTISYKLNARLSTTSGPGLSCEQPLEVAERLQRQILPAHIASNVPVRSFCRRRGTVVANATVQVSAGASACSLMSTNRAAINLVKQSPQP